MHLILPLGAALAVTAVSGTAPNESRPSDSVPAVREAVRDPALCADRIEQVRAQRRLPPLQRDTASPDEALLLAAVDKRIDGWGVLVMHRDTSDIRPVPQLPENAGMMKAQ
ncbi:hypothetical protein [Altericroceibacterium xinjiangense]|uniref:hypothetical protein n=1 Tax=Altericroceibacterium xinjiangense TaxID=762261 RepID=UPI000F7D8404|nr:hypothetical protein [Altericroceibacterium xinjiangense]